MTTTSIEPFVLLRALEATSREGAIAHLDGLLRLADNPADGLLCASTDGFPCLGLADMFDRAARVVEDAAAELRGAASRAEPVSPAGRAPRARAIGTPRVALVPVEHRRPGRTAMPGRGACLDLACVALLLLGAAGTYAELWQALP